MAKEGDYAQVRLPSGEVRRVSMDCMATIGQVGNTDHANINLGKAGRKRWLGIRPTVRGTAWIRIRIRTVVVKAAPRWVCLGPRPRGASPPWVTRPARTSAPNKFIVRRRGKK